MLAEAPQANSLEGLDVLVVEDDEDARELLSELLTAHGARVRTAPDTVVGMNALLDLVPHVLVSDIGLPGENGYAFMERCRRSTDEKLRRVPSVALTAYTRTADRIRATEAGFDDFLAKPVDFDRLLQTVARLGTSRQRE